MPRAINMKHRSELKWIALQLLLLLLVVGNVVDGQVITGKIVSCSGCGLNQLRALKSFLKEREAEYYVGLEVEYIRGAEPVLTIMEDGNEREKIDLMYISTKDEMHRLMIEKGFQRKSDEEIGRIKAERYWLLEEEKVATLKRNEELIELHRARIEERKLREEEREAEERRNMVMSFTQPSVVVGDVASAREEL